MEYDEREYGEERWIAIGRLGLIIAYVVYTNRTGVIRLISARKASHEEESRYYRRWL